MNKKLRKIIKRSLLTLFIIIASLITFILFPQLLFANKMKYKNFKVCSNNKISPDIQLSLDSALIFVQKSELYDPSYKYKIILCHNTFYNKIDGLIFGNGPAARAIINNVIIKVRIDPGTNRAFATFPNNCEINLAYLLAHEMIHCLQVKKYGIMKFNPFRHPPYWKWDGYPEYISRRAELEGKDYSLPVEIDQYVTREKNASDIWVLTGNGCVYPNYYYKGRLMIEYLMDIKHQTYDQILKDTISESAIFDEMIKWKDSVVLKK